MQDRFKVRVWNTLIKKFSYFDKPEMQIGTDGVDSGLIFPLSDNSNLYMGKYSELQFCTGKKDKNGNLIYEGDIMQVEFKNEFKNETHIAVVEYDKKDTGFGCKFNPKSDILYSLSPMELRGLIIGNIYKNPELLKKFINENKKRKKTTKIFNQNPTH